MQLKISTVFILFSLVIFIGQSALAAKFKGPVTGNDARTLYELAWDEAEDPDATKPTELSAGCHYTKKGRNFELIFCDSEIGFLNESVGDILSNILLANRTPVLMEEDRYAIGVHYICSVNKMEYSCILEDLSDFNSRASN